MSVAIKTGFTKKLNDPEKALENEKKAYSAMVELLAGDDPFKDDGKQYFRREKELNKWAIDPVASSQTRPLLQPPIVPLSPQGTQIPGRIVPELPRGFGLAILAPIILISVTLIALTSLTFVGLIPPTITVLVGIFAILLYFLPNILQLFKSNAKLEQKETVAGLFEMAHEKVRLLIFSRKKLGADPKIYKNMMIVAVLELSNIFRKIHAISESEWYARKILNDENAIRMGTSGSSMGPQVSG